MTNRIHSGAVIYAKDIASVSRFYAEIAGLAVSHQESGFIVLESPGFQLVVVAIPAHIAAQVQVASPPERREDTAVKLIFLVPSIAAARSTAARLGGALNEAGREWQFQSYRVCDGNDPEGNVIQFRENAL